MPYELLYLSQVCTRGQQMSGHGTPQSLGRQGDWQAMQASQTVQDQIDRPEAQGCSPGIDKRWRVVMT